MMILLGGQNRLFFVEDIMNEITYRIVRSDRRTTAIRICPDGTVLVRCPRSVPDSRIKDLVKEKENWIRQKLASQPATQDAMSREQVQALADKARQYLPSRVAGYAAQMGVTYGRITIRSQRTRWGSCSGKGNLNFNCLLMLMPPPVIDYVVIHELSHRKHMNHSANFWKTVETYMPNYQQHRKWLKKNGAALLGRLPR